MNRQWVSGGRRSLRRGMAALFAVSVLIAIGAGSAQAAITYTGSFGEGGGGAGQFSSPSGIAVSQSSGDVYVADRLGHRIEQFDSSGAFIRTWGQGVNQTSGGNFCTAASGDVCKAGIPGGASGQLSQPRGVAIDPESNTVYVQDGENNRVQAFTATGQFILMWGKRVNFTTGGKICTAASGDVCAAGRTTTTGELGVFSGWGPGSSPNVPVGNNPNIAVDGSGYVYVGDPGAIPEARVEKFDSSGNFVGQIAGPVGEFQERGINELASTSVNAAGDVYVTDVSPNGGGLEVERFNASEFTETGSTAKYEYGFGIAHLPQIVTVDPTNQYLVTGGQGPKCPGTSGPTGYHLTVFHPSGEEVDCMVPTAPPITKNGEGGPGGLAVSAQHKLYVVDPQANKVLVFDMPTATQPTVAAQVATEITTIKAVLKSSIAANLEDTTYHLEYGASPCSVPGACASTPESGSIGAAFAARAVSRQVTGLTPNTTYYYRFVATNALGTVAGPDRRFTTYPSPVFDPSCTNNLARQQTSAALLLDCRAYELVSASNTGGYNVESDLIPGEHPFGGYPYASGKALYGIHNGGIPNIGKPTNRGLDPYVATRDAANRRWNTEYVGIPSDAPSAAPFASTLAGADAGLTTFSFGGPDLCDPCFPDGSKGAPVHRADGSLVQAMAGSLDPGPSPSAGTVRKALSADGAHFIFGSTGQFEPAANSNGADATIYDRNLSSGVTQVVSTLPDGSTIAAGEGVAALDVSKDGSRILIGELVRTDGAGNSYWHLYMHVGGSPQSIDLTPGTTEGVIFNGATADGSVVYFTTVDPLVDDGDTGADVFRADVGPISSTLSRVSIGSGATGDTDSCDPAGNSYNDSDWNVIPGGPTDCSVVAAGGGGGVASGNGRIYFLSPEQLDGTDGVAGAPNLYVAAAGSAPEFVSTLESSASAPLPGKAHSFVRAFGSFVSPDGLAIDRATGSSYVLDNLETVEAPGAFVQKFDSSGNVDGSFGTDGKIDGSESPSGAFRQFGGEGLGAPVGVPLAVAVDNLPSSPSYRNLYVPDAGHLVIDKFGPSGNYISQIALEDVPTSVAVNPTNGYVYVAGLSGTVFVFDTSGNQVESFAIPAFLFSDIGVDSSGRIYVTEQTQTGLYSPSGTLIRTIEADPSWGVDVDPIDDHVYIDQGDQVVEFDADGIQVGQPIGVGRLSESSTLAVDGGRVIVGNMGGGNALEFGPAAVPPSPAYDNPLVVDSVREAETRRTGDLQVTRDGAYAAFSSTLPLTDFESAGHYEAFRYAADGSAGLRCVSCSITGSSPTTDAELAANGLSLTDDGRVFFTTGEALVLRDTDAKKDAYEWSGGKVELISSGTSSFDSGLLSVTADGTDAFFFTRDTFVEDDHNPQLMKIYDARENGGFFIIPPPPPCAASDECHGAGSPAPPVPGINTEQGKGGNVAPQKLKCKKGFVVKKGKCVKRKPKHHKPRRKHQHRNGQAK